MNDTTITIKNTAYKTNKNNSSVLGSKISLALIPEWKDIKDKLQISGVNKLLGGYFKIPIANTKDNISTVGVPIFAKCY